MTRRLSLVTVTLWLVAAVLIGAMIIGSRPHPGTRGRFTATQWRDLIINGVALGAVYALIALGYTLVYGILFMINFAHGEVFMAGAFTAYFAASGARRRGASSTPTRSSRSPSSSSSR